MTFDVQQRDSERGDILGGSRYQVVVVPAR
jgi:hypothetical protein